MNRIILIGNGFDLAHGMKTKYEHFLDGFWKQTISEMKECNSPEYKNENFQIKSNMIEINKIMNLCLENSYKSILDAIEETNRKDETNNNFRLRKFNLTISNNLTNKFFNDLLSIKKKLG